MSDPGRLDVAVEVVTLDGREIACVRPAGEIDLANAEELAAVISSPELAGCVGTLIDLREVEFMDSSGLRMMLISANNNGERFATILSEESAVARLFEMVDVGDRLNVMASEGQALARIRAGADAPG